MTQIGMLGRSLCGLGLVVGLSGAAQAASPAAEFTVGSPAVAVADPAVPRPSEKACTVELFNDVSFDDFGTRPYSYAPPTGCGTHWKKVVLEADFSVTAGRQFDRTATLWLDGVNLYFGTTQEPSATVSPQWHVERDLTDYSALLRQAGQGQAIIGNLVNGTYTGVIHGSARLVFYPGGGQTDAPDAVYALGADPVGNTTVLNASSDRLAKTFTLPRNVERAYLDVFTQSQGGDEFWYTCVPDAYAAQTFECGGGNFREAEVSIDGQPAGVAPVMPWIYTGGIDPYLWRPTPGVQTLNFMPYRVDLTPFAGLLSDGAPHEVALSVAGAHGYFSATAALLVYRDPQAAQVSGRIVRNTLAGQPPTPTIGSTLATDADGNLSGDVTTQLTRQFTIEGYADTSRGRVRSTVTQTVGFDDTQSFLINASTYDQHTVQLTRVDSLSTRQRGPLAEIYEQHVRYPLDLDYRQLAAADGSLGAAATVRQGQELSTTRSLAGVPLYATRLSNQVEAADTLQFSAAGAFIGHTGQRNTQAYRFDDTLGSCYQASVSSVGGLLSAYTQGQGCPGGSNHLGWFSRPDGAPDSRGQAPF
ncbi:peptide-N4-asparagine amidase [Frateuria sp.]|uniref:peptide-N4-asparagine amidase n=1 Tax=Frateuria sp. TaxID=2211372 RepID=UPI0025BE7224|nr:peptide-N4-asparagine amidase [Frateuria sp.]